MSSRIFKTLMFGVFAISLLHSPIAVAEDGDTEFAYATGLFQKQRWKYAVEALDQFLRKYPDHSKSRMAQLYYGLALNSDEQYGPARQTLRDFLKRYPGSRNAADAEFRIAECSYGLKDYKSAVTEFTHYLATYKDHNLRSWAVLMLGESHNERRQWKQAEAVLKPLTTSADQQRIVPDALFALGVALQGQRRSADALAVFEKVAATTSPALTRRAYARIATIHFTDKRYRKADTFYQKIISEFPGDGIAVTAALQSGIARFQLKQYQQALSQLKSVPESSTAAVHAAMWRGLCHRELNDLVAARASLSAAYQSAGDQPLAAEVLYNRAQVEVLAGEKRTAAQMFLDLADRWPENRHVADSLFNAAQLKTEFAETTTAQHILERLVAEFPDRSDAASTKVLRGRLLLSSGDAKQAVELLAAAAQEATTDTRERLFRHYHLIRALHRDKRYRDMLKTFDLIHPALVESQSNEFIGATALAAMSCLELKDYARAKGFADEFLAAEQRPDHRADATAARAVALSHLKNFTESLADLSVLVRDFADNRQTWLAVLQAAEAAWSAEAWRPAATMFELATGEKAQSLSPRLHQSAVSGAAWSRYRLEELTVAAELFHQHYSLYPESQGAVEAGYMEAMCRLDLQDQEAAAERFVALYQQLAAETSLEEDRARYLLDSGRRAAHLLGRRGEVDGADRIWEQLALRFSDHPGAASMLDEWAFTNLEHERYDRSDEIYKRLLNDYPDSRFAGQARLSLAESALSAGRLDAALREFTAIVASQDYGEAEQEAALYHVVDIHAAKRQWAEVIRNAERFAASFSGSERAPRVQLLHAEALLDQNRLADAVARLESLQAGLKSGALVASKWTDRIWIVAAEIALAQKRYAEIDEIEEGLRARSPQSPFLFQIHDVQGRRWKNQAPPDFDKSRRYFALVTNHEEGRVSETAARCQFLIGETYLLQKNYKAAFDAYNQVYLLCPFDEWRVRGLFQAAGCELSLGDTDNARKSYQMLIEDFPDSDLAVEAKLRLSQLPGSG